MGSGILRIPRGSDTTAGFFSLTFAITWGLQVPALLVQRGGGPIAEAGWLSLAALGMLGPLVAATVLTGREGGRRAVKGLYAGLLRWRAPVRWYVVALLPALLLTELLALLGCAGRVGPISFVPAGGALVFGVVASVVEEVGWRGYALPRLQRRWGAFGASGVLAVLWCLWHIPMLMGMGVPLSLLLVLLLLLLGVSLTITKLYNVSGGSLLLCTVAHFALHLNNSHEALPEDVVPVLVHGILYAALGLVLMRSALVSERGRRGALQGFDERS